MSKQAPPPPAASKLAPLPKSNPINLDKHGPVSAPDGGRD
jgi:hypothetical protein